MLAGVFLSGLKLNNYPCVALFGDRNFFAAVSDPALRLLQAICWISTRLGKQWRACIQPIILCIPWEPLMDLRKQIDRRLKTSQQQPEPKEFRGLSTLGD